MIDTASAVAVVVAHGLSEQLAWRLMPLAIDGHLAGMMDRRDRDE
ncbi:MAG: hypothetical protein AAFR84_02360 [Pseudomonadota bacterium]